MNLGRHELRANFCAHLPRPGDLQDRAPFPISAIEQPDLRAGLQPQDFGEIGRLIAPEDQM